MLACLFRFAKTNSLKAKKWAPVVITSSIMTKMSGWWSATDRCFSFFNNCCCFRFRFWWFYLFFVYCRVRGVLSLRRLRLIGDAMSPFWICCFSLAGGSSVAMGGLVSSNSSVSWLIGLEASTVDRSVVGSAEGWLIDVASVSSWFWFDSSKAGWGSGAGT